MAVGGLGSIQYIKSGMQQGGTTQGEPPLLGGGVYVNGKK